VTNLNGSPGYWVTLASSNSVIALVANGTLNYTFTDPNSGLAVIVAVTLAPWSGVTNNPAFTLLDTYGYNGLPVHAGIDSSLGNGDGNWIDYWEGLNFSATLVSAASGILTNTVQFGITGIGMRPGSGTALWVWTSPAGTNDVPVADESLATLDTSLAGRHVFRRIPRRAG